MAGVTSLFTGNDTGFGNQRVGKGGLTVIDVGNHRHVTNVMSIVHDLSNLFESEVRHFLFLECFYYYIVIDLNVEFP